MTKEEKKKELEDEIVKIYADLPPFVETEQPGIVRNRTKAELNTLRLAKIVHEIIRELL